MGLEAELQNSCCQGQQAKDEFDAVFALVEVLDTFSGHTSHFCE